MNTKQSRRFQVRRKARRLWIVTRSVRFTLVRCRQVQLESRSASCRKVTNVQYRIASYHIMSYHVIHYRRFTIGFADLTHRRSTHDVRQFALELATVTGKGGFDRHIQLAVPKRSIILKSASACASSFSSPSPHLTHSRFAHCLALNFQPAATS